MDMSFRPRPSWGKMRFALLGLRAPLDAGEQRQRGAVDVRVEQADLRAFVSASESARFTAAVLLPTPPLPEATARVLRTPGRTGAF